jgi:nicotinamide-nucleotide amidase
MTGTVGETAGAIIEACSRAGLRIAVAESLTGGLVVAGLVSISGASKVVAGGVVAYDTALKHSVVGVDEELLRTRGAVDPDVAFQMADRIRTALAVDGRAADVGIATTGVAGPDQQDGKPVGLAYIGLAIGDAIAVHELHLSGSREDIRAGVVSECFTRLSAALAHAEEPGE